MLGNTSFQTSNFSFKAYFVFQKNFTSGFDFSLIRYWIEVSRSLFCKSICHCEGKNNAKSIFREAKFGSITVCYHRNSVHGNWSQITQFSKEKSLHNVTAGVTMTILRYPNSWPSNQCAHEWMKSFPGGTSSKETSRQGSTYGFNPWVRKIPWRRKWQLTPIFLPGESHGQRSLAGYSPQHRRV